MRRVGAEPAGEEGGAACLERPKVLACTDTMYAGGARLEMWGRSRGARAAWLSPAGW